MILWESFLFDAEATHGRGSEATFVIVEGIQPLASMGADT